LPRHPYKAANRYEIERIDSMIRDRCADGPRGPPYATYAATGTTKRRLFLETICIFFILFSSKPDNLPATFIALTKTHDARRKTQTELLHPNTCPFCRNKVTKFMHKHEKAKDRNSS